MNKPKLWDGKGLKGRWVVTLKLDGVRMLRDSLGNPVSRNNKPLYNLEHIPEEVFDAEIFLGNWEDTVSACRSKNKEIEVTLEDVYSLEPLDSRLYMGYLDSPSPDEINNLLGRVVAKGNEGLVLRQGAKWIKVKPTLTYDVKVVGKKMGKGKNIGLLGSLLTTMGSVGTGLTDDQRATLLEIPDGTIIEVECMELTPNGKFRHPRFKRVREDKDTETLQAT